MTSDKIDKRFVKRYDTPSEKDRWSILKELNTNVEELLTKAKRENTFLKSCLDNPTPKSRADLRGFDNSARYIQRDRNGTSWELFVKFSKGADMGICWKVPS